MALETKEEVKKGVFFWVKKQQQQLILF